MGKGPVGLEARLRGKAKSPDFLIRLHLPLKEAPFNESIVALICFSEVH